MTGRKYAPRGAGSVRHDGSSGQMRVVIDGVQRFFRAPTLAQARARADLACDAAEARARPQTPTVRDWLATWLEARRPDLRPQAWGQYEIHARVWLVPGVDGGAIRGRRGGAAWRQHQGTDGRDVSVGGGTVVGSAETGKRREQ